MDRYEVFPGSISQEENWTDSVRSNNNMAWANQCALVALNLFLIFSWC